MAATAAGKGKPYKVFTTEKHPEYRPDYWAKCRALYSGDMFEPEHDQVLSSILLRRNAEDPDDYKKRKAQSFYKNYPGSIIDKIIAALFSEQPSMQPVDGEEADPWYTDWLKDVSRPGGQKMSFNELLKVQMRTALQLRRAWTLIDLPRLPEGVRPNNLGDQEQLGGLRAYAAPVEPESVWDWQTNDDGELEWVLLAFQRQRRNGLDDARGEVEEEFVYYTRTAFERYIICYPKDKPPGPDDTVPLVDSGPHSFGRVPMCMLELPPGLHAMGKLESLARAHMVLSNSLHYSTINSLFPTPVAYQGADQEGNPATSDPDRATRQKRSPYHTVVLGAGDRFEFVGPSAEPFAQAAAQEREARDEMYRVVHSMADSVDNTAAALQRSGDSKRADKESEAKVCKALGEKLNEYGCDIIGCVGVGRGDKGRDGKPIEWVMKGMEEFDSEDSKSLLEKEQAIVLLDIKSPTYHIEHQFNWIKRDLGENATPEMMAKIRKELEQNNPPEMYEPREPPEQLKPFTGQGGASQPGQDGEDGEDDAANKDTNNGAAKAAEKE